MQIGLVGFAGSGKSTLFAALSGKEAPPAGGGLGQAAQAVVRVPDQRLEWLRELFQPKKFTPAALEFTDFAGVPRSAEKGKAELFARIREMDALLLVAGAFAGAADAGEVPGGPVAVLTALQDELLLADLEIVERRQERLEQSLKKGATRTRDRDEREIELMARVREALEAGGSLLAITRGKDDEELLRTYRFLRQKPLIAVVNCGEEADRDALAKGLAGRFEGPCFVAPLAVEAEIAAMAAEDRGAFLAEYGLDEPVRDAIVRAAFAATRSIPFFTVGEDEVRAWVIQDGESALVAAGKIHSDIARGFIRAEVFSYDDLRQAGSMKELKARNLMRLEGKEYVVKNGEIVHFRFSV